MPEGEEQKSLRQPTPLQRRLPATATYSRGRSLICNQTLEHAGTHIPSHVQVNPLSNVLSICRYVGASRLFSSRSLLSVPAPPTLLIPRSVPHPTNRSPPSLFSVAPPTFPPLLTVQLAQEAHGMFRESVHNIKSENKVGGKQFFLYVKLNSINFIIEVVIVLNVSTF